MDNGNLEQVEKSKSLCISKGSYTSNCVNLNKALGTEATKCWHTWWLPSFELAGVSQHHLNTTEKQEDTQARMREGSLGKNLVPEKIRLYVWICRRLTFTMTHWYFWHMVCFFECQRQNPLQVPLFHDQCITSWSHLWLNQGTLQTSICTRQKLTVIYIIKIQPMPMSTTKMTPDTMLSLPWQAKAQPTFTAIVSQLFRSNPLAFSPSHFLEQACANSLAAIQCRKESKRWPPHMRAWEIQQ